MKALSGIVILSMLLCGQGLSAQEHFKVSGRVLDESGQAVIGAGVQDLSNKAATVTDLDGRFVISASSANASLHFSCIGMVTEDIPIGGRNEITVVMKTDALALNGVVVTALGIKRESRALGYSMVEVKGEDVTAGHERNLMSALSGKVPGVDISSTGGGLGESTRVIIRGNSQLSGSNMPLYVVDGVPIDNTQMGSANEWGGNDFGDGISSLSPENIESVSVLKGASAAALYGSRASNGVVLITTKNGGRQKGLGVEYSANLGMVKLLSSFDDYQRVYGNGRAGSPPMNIEDAAGTTMSAWGGMLDPDLSVLTFDGTYRPYANVDNNILSFFRTGYSMAHTVSLSGGSDQSQFRVSIADNRISDIVPSSNASRTTFSMRGSTKLGKNMGVEGRVEYTVENVNNRPGLSDDPSNIGNSIIGLAPNLNQLWLKEGSEDEYGRYVDWNGNNIYRLNPYWVINRMRNITEMGLVIGFLMYHWDILPGLRFQVRGGTDFYHFETNQYSARYTPTQASGAMTLTHRNISENNYEAMLRYSRKFAKLEATAFIAGNIRSYRSDRLINKGENEVVPGLIAIGNYSNPSIPQHQFTRKQVNSVYGAVNLGWNDIAYIDFTLRNDISSTLAASHRSYIYPSVSGSLIFSKLLGIENSFMSFGKLRASWAMVGGDTDPYQLDLTYGLSDMIFRQTSLGIIKATSIPYKDLKPTSTYSYEFGTDLRFFKGRINLDAAYYYSSTKDQILGLPVSISTGYNKAMINAGEICNKGIEVLLSVLPVSTRDFEWESSLNFARNINQVKSLHEEVKDYQLSVARWANAFIYAREGEAYGVIVGPAFARDTDGNVIFDKGLPTYTSDVQILGNGNYDFTLGLQENLRWKGIRFGMLFDMKFGADIYSMTARTAYSSGIASETLEGRREWYISEEARKAANASEGEWEATGGYVGKGVMNIGTKEEPIWAPNTVKVNPETYWKNVANNTPEPFIYDASFIKLRELSLSYDLPAKLLSRTPIRGLSVSVYGRNLLTLYKQVFNIDPESNYSSGNGQGLEYGSLPSRRTYGAGLNIKF